MTEGNPLNRADEPKVKVNFCDSFITAQKNVRLFSHRVKIREINPPRQVYCLIVLQFYNDKIQVLG